MAKGDYKSGLPRKPRVNHEKERAEKFLELLREARFYLDEYHSDLGGCDHSANICVCGLRHLCEDIKTAIECEDRSAAFIAELDS